MELSYELNGKWIFRIYAIIVILPFPKHLFFLRCLGRSFPIFPFLLVILFPIICYIKLKEGRIWNRIEALLTFIGYGGDTGSTANGEQREACRRRSLRKKPKKKKRRKKPRSRCLKRSDVLPGLPVGWDRA